MHISKFWLWLQKAHFLSEIVCENNYLQREFDILRRSALTFMMSLFIVIKIYVVKRDSDLENVLNYMCNVL